MNFHNLSRVGPPHIYMIIKQAFKKLDYKEGPHLRAFLRLFKHRGTGMYMRTL